MKPEQLTEALEAAAKQLGVQVKYEPLAPGGVSGSGGLCKVKGAWWVIIDKKATPSERAAVLSEALSNFDTDAVFLPPKAREAVMSRKGPKAAG
jgi:hypothetical protein